TLAARVDAGVPDSTILDNAASATADQVNLDLAAATSGNSLLVPGGVLQVTNPTPASGSGASQTITYQFSHPNGYQYLNVVNVLINNFLDGRNACYLAYVVPSTTLVLVDDAGRAQGPYAGTLVLGDTGSIQNSQCSVSLVSAQGAGTTLTLKLNITFKPVFGGNKIEYVAARDTGSGNTDWQALGVWQVPFTP